MAESAVENAFDASFFDYVFFVNRSNSFIGFKSESFAKEKNMRKTLLLKLFALLLVCVLGMQSTALANLADHTSTTAYGKEIELEELRTTDSKTYQLSDGSFQYVGYADDVHYKDSNGKFAEIDNSITNSAEKDGYAYTNTANSWRAYFSNQLSTSKAVLLEMGDYSLSFSMPSASQQGTAKNLLIWLIQRIHIMETKIG